MKKSFAVAATLATALLATTASAEEFKFQGCTADGKTATLVADVEGKVGEKSLKSVVADAFRAAVQKLDSAAVPGEKGFTVFMNELGQALAKQEVSKDAALTVSAAPVVGGPACKP